MTPLRQAHHGPATTLPRDKACSVIVRNASPDVPFSQSINPYKGCASNGRCLFCARDRGIASYLARRLDSG